jgi:hypothetical protein
MMQQQQHQLEQWLAGGGVGGMLRPTKSAPCSPVKPLAAPSAQAAMLRTHSESFHVAHKVPVGDTPYVRAKRVQVRCPWARSLARALFLIGFWMRFGWRRR